MARSNYGMTNKERNHELRRMEANVLAIMSHIGEQMQEHRAPLPRFYKTTTPTEPCGYGEMKIGDA